MNKKSFRPDTIYVREAFCPDVATMRLTARGQAAGAVAPIADEVEVARARLRALRREHRKAMRDIRELKEAVAARDALIAIAGHELRNPMGAIVVSVTNMLFRARGEQHLPPWVEPRLRGLDKQARNFVRRATTLLDVSRLTTGLPCIDREHVNLAGLARDIVSELTGEAESAGCEIHLAVEDETVGSWDRAALEQIAVNLVSNAIKYGAGRPVEVSVASLGANALLRVRDQGIGIAKADLERIFERFERAVTRRERPGFGLGLWIARQLVLAHGGEITVESELGVGSVFTATLPRAITEPTR